MSALSAIMYREGKIRALEQWLSDHGENLDDSWFYSDSHNDIPLLEHVAHPVAVDPDNALRRHAEQKGWAVITLREETKS